MKNIMPDEIPTAVFDVASDVVHRLDVLPIGCIEDAPFYAFHFLDANGDCFVAVIKLEGDTVTVLRKKDRDEQKVKEYSDFFHQIEEKDLVETT